MSTFYQPGDYIGEVLDQGLSQAKTGTHQVFFRCRITNRVDRSVPQERYEPVEAAYERTVFRALTEKTVERVAADLRAMGFDGNAWSQIDPRHPQAWNVIGREIALRCSHESYQGQMRERWDLAANGGSAQIEKIDGKAARQIDALFGKALKSAPVAAKAQPATAEAPAAQPEATSAPAASDALPF